MKSGTTISAHDFQNDYYNCVALYGKHRWECLGYSKGGQTVKFARMTWSEAGFRQITVYLKPETLVEILTLDRVMHE